MSRYFLKQDHEALRRLRTETRRMLWQVRLMRLLVVLACVLVLDVLARWHAPQVRAELLSAAAAWLRSF